MFWLYRSGLLDARYAPPTHLDDLPVGLKLSKSAKAQLLANIKQLRLQVAREFRSPHHRYLFSPCSLYCSRLPDRYLVHLQYPHARTAIATILTNRPINTYADFNAPILLLFAFVALHDDDAKLPYRDASWGHVYERKLAS